MGANACMMSKHQPQEDNMAYLQFVPFGVPTRMALDRRGLLSQVSLFSLIHVTVVHFDPVLEISSATAY